MNKHRSSENQRAFDSETIKTQDYPNLEWTKQPRVQTGHYLTEGKSQQWKLVFVKKTELNCRTRISKFCLTPTESELFETGRSDWRQTPLLRIVHTKYEIQWVQIYCLSIERGFRKVEIRLILIERVRPSLVIKREGFHFYERSTSQVLFKNEQFLIKWRKALHRAVFTASGDFLLLSSISIEIVI